ncbi:MAG: arginine--tRNA ligase, partial [Proteobacteria bacterium]|nr:arginine--tRNA ligase [Pseudomonadota bacterium]
KSEINSNKLGSGNYFENKKILVEYTDPNPFKLFHIGHFMTNALGESVYRLIRNQGGKTFNVCYQGDVGIHIAKTIYGLVHFMNEGLFTLEDFLKFNTDQTIEEFGKAYVFGSKMYDTENEKIKIQDLNNLVFTISQELPEKEGVPLVNKYQNSKYYEFEKIRKIYQKGRQDSLDYFEKIYQKLGTNFQDYFFESITGEIGTKIINESPIFKESEGAIIWDGKEIGHNVQVLINSYGIPTYGAKEIGLNLLKKQKYNPEISIVCTAKEQEFYFRDLIEIFNQLGFSQETIHLAHGELRLTSGKMSSRTGEVITLEEIINQIKEHIIVNFSSKKDQKFLEKISEKIAISSLKYLILKNSIGSNIIYDPEKITDLNGNTGSYLQYTYARCQSVLKKGGIFNFRGYNQITNLERDILINFLMFSEITRKAAIEYSPSTLATYLHETAKKFNYYYDQNKILDDNEEIREFRMFICFINAFILKKGLELLGIESIEEI